MKKTLFALLAALLLVPTFVQTVSADLPVPTPAELRATRQKAESGDAEAQCQLGRYYYESKGVERDYFAAAKWYRKSADQGNEAAKNALRDMGVRP